MNRAKDYFTDILKTKKGLDHSILDYGSADSQKIKYSVIADLIPIKSKSILDVGCGLCDFKFYLNHNTSFSQISYLGIDITPGMAQRAKAKYGGDLPIHISSLDDFQSRTTFDVVTANGIFYLESNGYPSMDKSISKMFEMANKAVIFNSLSSYAPVKTNGEFYADPIHTIANLVLKHSSQYVLRTDYHSRDFTIAIYK